MKKQRNRILYLTAYGILGITISFLFMYPEEISAAVCSSLQLCAHSVIPSLFPFLVISALIISSGLAEKTGRLLSPFMSKVFKLPGESAAAVIIGFLSGYPVGAASAISLYQNGSICKADTERLLAFCNNTGPAFVISAIGASMFGDIKIGIALYFVHIVSAIIVGILFSFTAKREKACYKICSVRKEPFTKQIVSAVKSSAFSTIYIVSFVVFFSVIIEILSLGLQLSGIPHCAVSGLFEVTSGVSSAAELGITPFSLIFTSVALGWSGLSVHAQVMSLVADTDLSAKTYIIGKAVHGIIAALITFLLLIL